MLPGEAKPSYTAIKYILLEYRSCLLYLVPKLWSVTVHNFTNCFQIPAVYYKYKAVTRYNAATFQQ